MTDNNAARGVSLDDGRMVIVPDEIWNTIQVKVDEQILLYPAAEPDRDLFCNILLHHYDANGVIPPFELVPSVEVNNQKDVL